MTVAFMGLFASTIGERIDFRAGLWLLWPLVWLGLASVYSWHTSEQRGAGDLRLYYFVQFYPMVAIPLMTATRSEASTHHVRKHHKPVSWNNSARRSWAAGEIRSAAPTVSAGGDVCPGSARSFDCKIWPPPIYDDPDRKATSSDGN